MHFFLSKLQVAERAEALGSGLLQQGCKPSTKQFIGVFAQNRPEVRFYVQRDTVLIMLPTCQLVLKLYLLSWPLLTFVLPCSPAVDHL